jgi:hypothetical protein
VKYSFSLTILPPKLRFGREPQDQESYLTLNMELKMIEMENNLILHVVHVSGKRMIRQGSDGLSRANHSQGVMTGAPMESFIPLHQSAIERES